MISRPRAWLQSLLVCRRGAAALEFAVVAIPMATLCLGIMEFGRLSWTREALQAAATEGARCMAMTSSSCATGGAYSQAKAQTYVTNTAKNWNVTVSTSQLQLNHAATCASLTGFSQVQITYTFQSPLPLLANMHHGIPLSVSACFPNQT
jgi:Flp pilus assembly protein TadG